MVEIKWEKEMDAALARGKIKCQVYTLGKR
jgi:hypothetical protein